MDQVYMTFVQATTGHGGWPMSVWLTPDLRPFFGGTYFPPTDGPARAGFITVLRRIAELWKTERDQIEDKATSLLGALREAQEEANARGRGGLVARRDVDRGGRAVCADVRCAGGRLRRRAEISAAGESAVPARARGHAPAGHGRGRRDGAQHAAQDGARRECTTTSAAAFIATRSMRAGTSRISRRCSTTRRS